MNAIVPFDFETNPVRIQNRDGQPWFVLADVCRALEHSNPSMAAKALDDDERDTLNITDPIGRTVEAIGINESGLYRLILTSRKEAAKRFRKWVTGEVLPAIRRNGSYGAPAPALDLTDTATLRALLLDQTGRSLASDARVAELEPKAAALDRLTKADGSMSVTAAAKAMGVRPGRLFDWLEAERWLYRGADGLLGYQAKIDQGLIEHKVQRLDRGRERPRVVTQALLTTKGIARLTELSAGR